MPEERKRAISLAGCNRRKSSERTDLPKPFPNLSETIKADSIRSREVGH